MGEGQGESGQRRSMRNRKKNKNSGFTLIEILVVVLIVGILAAIALPLYNNSLWRAKGAQMLTHVKSLATAQEAYYNVHGAYGKDFDDFDLTFDILDTRPAASSVGPTVSSANAIRANDDYELIVNVSGSFALSTVFLKRGPYRGAGFAQLHRNDTGLNNRLIYCVEGTIYNINQGDFCHKVMGYGEIPVKTAYNARFFMM
jgi:prepilin-type N-terminal cleavage/methylation domain-containing protein